MEQTAPVATGMGGSVPAGAFAHILRACDLEGHTQRNYAQAHGLSLPAAKLRLLRTRQCLRDRLATVRRVHFEADGSVCGHGGRAAP